MGNGADVCTHRGASWESSGGQTLKFRVQPKAGLSRALVMQPDLEGMTCLDPSLPHGDPARSHCHSWPPFADGDADLDSHWSGYVHLSLGRGREETGRHVWGGKGAQLSAEMCPAPGLWLANAGAGHTHGSPPAGAPKLLVCVPRPVYASCMCYCQRMI